MLEWLVIGGGLQGTYASLVLVHAAGVRADDIRVIDAEPAALAAWRRRTRACGMRYLRSPQAHHLGLRADGLRRFAGTNPDAFIAPYRRPALGLFDAHADCVLAAAGLARLRIATCARGFSLTAKGYRVATDAGVFAARRVLLATGPGPPGRPAWARGLAHVFDPDFDRRAVPAQNLAVVGAGASGGQLALALAEAGSAVTLVARRGLRPADFDSDPCYLGRRCLAGFAGLSPRARQRAIAAARRPGTLPRDVYAALCAHRRIRVVTGHVAGQRDDGLALADGRALPADGVVLATGFDPARPGGAWLAGAIARLGLPVSSDGWPLIAPDLQWRRGLYVSGQLAQFELGPAAGNIAGARMAGRRLARAHAMPSAAALA